MKKQTPSQRIKTIRSRIDFIIEKNRKEVGTGQSIKDIELSLLSDVLDLGRMLLEDRIVEEEKKLEDNKYIIDEKKNKKEGE